MKLQPPAASTLRKYGLAPSGWQALLAHQGGRCPACGKTFTRTRRPGVDHDHRTGQVRGLLCLPCNHAVGVLHDNADWLERTAQYLRRPPADDCFDTPARHRDAPPEV